jgi:GNAT superfamily N-acetyltransferase
VRRVIIPASVDDPDAADFIGAITVRNAALRLATGSDDLAFTPADMLPNWSNPEFRPLRMFVAVEHGEVVGRGVYDMIAGVDAPEVMVIIEVAPTAVRRGVGTALFDRLREESVADGRAFIQAHSSVPIGDAAEWLEAPTGFGRIPLDSPGAQFAIATGATLEQVERTSRLAVPTDPLHLQELFDEARAAAGADYRVISWVGETPEDRIDDLASLMTRMSTEAPTAGLEASEAVWDASRVRARDATHGERGGSLCVSVAEYIPTGHLVAFTDLSAPGDTDQAILQGKTLVLTEHRGHRLGMLLKVANLQLLANLRPGHSGILTFNAEENRPMLAVNEAIGFEPVGYDAVWKLAL